MPQRCRCIQVSVLMRVRLCFHNHTIFHAAVLSVARSDSSLFSLLLITSHVSCTGDPHLDPDTSIHSLPPGAFSTLDDSLQSFPPANSDSFDDRDVNRLIRPVNSWCFVPSAWTLLPADFSAFVVIQFREEFLPLLWLSCPIDCYFCGMRFDIQKGNYFSESHWDSSNVKICGSREQY